MNQGYILLLFFGIIILFVVLILLLLLGKGRLVKNNIIFSAVQLFPIAFSLLTITTVGKDSVIGLIISFLCIMGCIAAVVLKKHDFQKARLLSVALIIISVINFLFV